MSRPPFDRLHRPLIVCCFAALAAYPSALRAQTSAIMDEGTLMVSRNGSPVGRESYRIVRAAGPGGQVFRATSSTAVGTTRVTTTLGADSAGVPLTYEADIAMANQPLEHVSGRGRPGRFSVLVQNRKGESAREYLLENGALLIDENVFHQYYFLTLAGSHARFNVIAPRRQEETTFRFEERGAETLDIGGRKIESRHLVLVGDAGTREMWVDANGRLLKVAMPAEGLVALRDDPPRD